MFFKYLIFNIKHAFYLLYEYRMVVKHGFVPVAALWCTIYFSFYFLVETYSIFIPNITATGRENLSVSKTLEFWATRNVSRSDRKSIIFEFEAIWVYLEPRSRSPQLHVAVSSKGPPEFLRFWEIVPRLDIQHYN